MSTPDPAVEPGRDPVVDAFAARIRRNLDAVAGEPRSIMILIIGAAAACWLTDRESFARGHVLALADLALECLGISPEPAAGPATVPSEVAR